MWLWFLWIPPPDYCCSLSLFRCRGTEWLWKAWRCHLHEWHDQPETLVDSVWSTTLVKHHHCHSIWDVRETHKKKDLTETMTVSGPWLPREVKCFFENEFPFGFLSWQRESVFPLRLFSLFLAQLIVFICLQNHMPASSPLPFLKVSCLLCTTVTAKNVLLTWEPVG